MKLSVRLSTTLRAKVPGYQAAAGLKMEMPDSSTAKDLAEKLGLPLSEIKIVMLNGRRAELEDRLKDGDRVGYFPAVGGGSEPSPGP